MKPGVLAVKAINQYRRRDIIPYLGLRYYLDNTCAMRDRWINEISTSLTIDRSHPNYLKSYHFKDIKSNGDIEHRIMYFPGANEALAETSLLTELSKHKAFLSASYVFSYNFSSTHSKQGIFEPYFNGFKVRHNSIAKACKSIDNGHALYTDIKKFYPSISAELAKKSWDDAVKNSNLPKYFIDLGDNILQSHKQVCDRDHTGAGILTGPIFSHLIANLILKPIDEEMNKLTNGFYWRYVDDVVMVGSSQNIEKWRSILEKRLDEIGLELHSGDKDFTVKTINWLKGENDFETEIGTPWISLIGNVKRFLLANPGLEKDLAKTFFDEDISIPIKSYAEATQESSYLQKFNDWRKKYKWSKRAVQEITIPSLVLHAKVARETFNNELSKLLTKASMHQDQFERKRLIPKIRYYSGRLLFLLNNKDLLELSIKLKEFHELLVLSEVMHAISNRDVSKIVELGANTTQAAAQILRISDEPVTGEINNLNNVNQQSLAVLTFNGININHNHPCEPLNNFAKGEKLKELMNSTDPFIKEIVCLHGFSKPRHNEIMDKAFDRDEDLAFDVINQLQNSSHC